MEFSSDDKFVNLCGAMELSDGRIMVNGSFSFRSGAGDFYSNHPALLLLDAEGNRIASNEFFKPGYCSSNVPFVFVNEDGGLYALFNYSPDHDSTYFNYFKNYDNPPTDAIVGLYKLDEASYRLPEPRPRCAEHPQGLAGCPRGGLRRQRQARP